MWRKRALLVLSVIGIAISVYLVIKAGSPSTVTCSLGGGCEKVLSSQYSKLFGLPVAGYGLLWYFVAIVGIWFTYFQKTITEYYFKLWSIGALLFSGYLFGLEALKIHSYCTWCLISLTIILLINGIIFFTKEQQ